MLFIHLQHTNIKPNHLIRIQDIHVLPCAQSHNLLTDDFLTNYLIGVRNVLPTEVVSLEHFGEKLLGVAKVEQWSILKVLGHFQFRGEILSPIA